MLAITAMALALIAPAHSPALDRPADALERPADALDRPADALEGPADALDRPADALDRLGPAYGAYVGCTPAARHGSAKCSLAAKPTTVFRAFRGKHVRYRACIRRPSGDVKCRPGRTGRKGSRSRQRVALSVRPGRYEVTWFVRGDRVARASFRSRAPRVFVNGDSLAVGTRPYLPGDLPGWPIEQSASISRQAPEGVDILRSKGRGLASVIVMSLGTNGDPRASDDFAAAVRETLRIAGPKRCVIWPNIVRPSVAGTSYDAYNDVLASLNRRNDNLYVVNWAAIAARNRGWFGPDGVHPGATGYTVRAKAIARKAIECLRGPLAQRN